MRKVRYYKVLANLSGGGTITAEIKAKNERDAVEIVYECVKDKNLSGVRFVDVERISKSRYKAITEINACLKSEDKV